MTARWSDPHRRAEIAGSLFAEVRVRDDRIVRATPARDEYRLLIASATALPQVVMARPEGVGRAPPTMVIEGVEELVDADGRDPRHGRRGNRLPAATAPSAWLAAGGLLVLAALGIGWLSVALGLASDSVETASNLPTFLLLLFLGSG